MDRKIIAACEAFSLGDAKGAVEWIDPEVIWNVVGAKTILGRQAMMEFCAEMTANGCPEFKNARTTVGESQVVVEGAELKEDGVSYCDSYAIRNGMIVEIRSYCVNSG